MRINFNAATVQVSYRGQKANTNQERHNILVRNFKYNINRHIALGRRLNTTFITSKSPPPVRADHGLLRVSLFFVNTM